jgi:hypothetical protein
VPKVGRIAQWVIGAVVSGAAAAAAHAQNLDAGKSPVQIFSDTCNACHRSPRELKQTTPGFMRDHYTIDGRQAAAMAAYLASVGSDPRAVQQRRPPTLGAGQSPPTETKPPESPPRGTDQPQETDQAVARPPQTIPPDTDQAKLPEAPAAPARRTSAVAERGKPSQGAAIVAAMPRRPSESLEVGKLPEGAPPQTAATPFTSIEDFEE